MSDCTVCRQINALACGKCGLDFYCTKAHQREDWPRHKTLVCRASPEMKAMLRRRGGCLDVNDEAMSGPSEYIAEKAALVEKLKLRGTRRLVTVVCNYDRQWSTELLRAAAPLVEELEVWNLDDAQWQLLHSMPRLYRLEVNTYFSEPLRKFPSLPPLPEDRPAGSGLLWVRTCLAREPTAELLRAHAATLREVQMFVGTAAFKGVDPLCGKTWPWRSPVGDLAELLRGCGLQSLRRLVLRRPCRPTWTLSGDFCHDAAPCRAQLNAVRAALPDANVLCGTCSNVTWRCFEETIFGMW